MRRLAPLAAALRPALAAATAMRVVSWLSVSLIVATAGSLLSLTASHAAWISARAALEIRMGILMAAASALPAFILWPPPEGLVRRRLRELDELTVFEAWLEAPEGPARDMLSRLAEERAAALAYRWPRRPLREALLALRAIRPLIATALACLVLAEAGSLIAFREPLALLREPGSPKAGGARIQEEDFSPFAGEGPEARRKAERELRGDGVPKPAGEEPGLGTANAGARPEGLAAPRRALRAGAGERALAGPAGLGRSGEAGAEGKGGPPAEGEQGTRAQAAEGKGEAGQARPQGRLGQGYENTGDTRVPSPLLDYRSRFSSVFAERTGKRISAADELALGALRDYERRYFSSFSIVAELGPGEEAYAALLKRRWHEHKGALR